MREYEKLKAVCDLIEYESEYWNTDVSPNWFYKWNCCWTEDIDVREIIFTQEFMDKLEKYLEERDWIVERDPLYYFLMKNLNDPVDYVYNLSK